MGFYFPAAEEVCPEHGITKNKIAELEQKRKDQESREVAVQKPVDAPPGDLKKRTSITKKKPIQKVHSPPTGRIAGNGPCVVAGVLMNRSQ